MAVQLPGDIAVASGFPMGDGLKGLPDRLLKFRSLRRKGHVKHEAGTLKVFVQLAGCLAQQGRFLPFHMLRLHQAAKENVRDGRSVFHDDDGPHGGLMKKGPATG